MTVSEYRKKFQSLEYLSVLRFLRDSRGAIHSIGAVGDNLGIDTGKVSFLLSGLRSEELVEGSHHGFCLSPKGWTLLVELESQGEAFG